MGKERKQYTKEFKQDTVKLIREGGKSVASICRDLGLTEPSIDAYFAGAVAGAGAVGVASRIEARQTKRGDVDGRRFAERERGGDFA